MSLLALLTADMSQHMTMLQALVDFQMTRHFLRVEHPVVLAVVCYRVSWRYHRDSLSWVFAHTGEVAVAAALMVGYLDVRHCFARGRLDWT